MTQPASSVLLAAYFLLLSFFSYSSTLKMEITCYSKSWMTFNGLLGAVPQKTEFFILQPVFSFGAVIHIVFHELS
jgi:hypothetical protein